MKKWSELNKDEKLKYLNQSYGNPIYLKLTHKEFSMEIKDLVKDVMSEFYNDCKSFTSLDISNEVKKRSNDYIRHRDVSVLVRQLFSELDFLDYEKELITVNLSSDKSVKAFLYRYVVSNPDDYITRSLKPSPPKQNTNSGGSSSDQYDSMTYAMLKKQKADGRLEVPKTLINASKWNSGDTIYISIKKPSVILTSVFSTCFYKTKVDEWNRLRIPASVMKRAELDDRDHEYLIEMKSDDEIVINE